MFASKKILTAALVALTLAGAGAASTGSAQAGGWHHHHGHRAAWGIGGLATGLVIGSALASRPAYAAPVDVESARRCFWVERTNRWGEVIGTRKVCRTYE